MAETLFYILVFPGFLFLMFLSFPAEYFDRILYARLQNRKGPPWFQPMADFIKLVSKEDVVPDEANPVMFRLMPVLALSAVVTAFLYIPLWKETGLLSFNGDLVVLVYLLTLPTLTFFLGGWYSSSLFAKIGAVRTITQLFAYEIPMAMCFLATGLLADTWQVSGIARFYLDHPLYMLFNIPGFFIALTTLLGKLEKVPFDIPEAETEIVAGTFTEYSGRLLAFFKLAVNIEMIVVAALLAAVFIPFGMTLPAVPAFLLFLAKVAFIIFLLSLLRTVFARLRIDQMMEFCWKILAPLSIAQILINLVLKGVLPR